jgi:hypothetical protein
MPETAATAAPYKIVKRGDKWVVFNNMGEKKAEFGSRTAALRYQRALYANVKGAPEAAGRKSFTGRQKAPARVKATAGESAVDKILRLTGR